METVLQTNIRLISALNTILKSEILNLAEDTPMIFGVCPKQTDVNSISVYKMICLIKASLGFVHY